MLPSVRRVRHSVTAPRPSSSSPAGKAEQAREVVARGTDLLRVVVALDAADDAEHAEDQRERAAAAAAQARISPRGEPQQGKRDEPADEMVAG